MKYNNHEGAMLGLDGFLHVFCFFNPIPFVTTSVNLSFYHFIPTSPDTFGLIG